MFVPHWFGGCGSVKRCDMLMCHFLFCWFSWFLPVLLKNAHRLKTFIFYYLSNWLKLWNKVVQTEARGPKQGLELSQRGLDFFSMWSCLFVLIYINITRSVLLHVADWFIKSSKSITEFPQTYCTVAIATKNKETQSPVSPDQVPVVLCWIRSGPSSPVSDLVRSGPCVGSGPCSPVLDRVPVVLCWISSVWDPGASVCQH